MNFVSAQPRVDNRRKVSAHVDALDGIRGIALLLVFGAHAEPQIFASGFIGVDLFFVLSGYLITGILLKERSATGSINIKQFYIRRALRLLPALFTLVLAVVAYAWLFNQPGFSTTLRAAGSVALYYWNWVLVSTWGPGWQGERMFLHLWSLSVEEQFYIVWPLVLTVALSMRRSALAIGSVLAIGILGPAIGRILVYQGSWSLDLYFRTDLHFDGLMWGALGAWVVSNRWLSGQAGRWVAVAGAFALIAYVIAARFPILENGIVYRGGWTLLGALASMAIVAAVSRPLPAVAALLEFRPLRWTGKVSYGLYLWHLPIFQLCHHLPAGYVNRDLLAVVLTYCVATASFYGIERHFLRLKQRFAAPA